MVKVRRNIEDPYYNYKASGLTVTRSKNDVTGYEDIQTFSQHSASDEVKELLSRGYKIYFE